MLTSKTYSEIIDHDVLPSIKVFAIGEDAILAMNSVSDLYEGCINFIALSNNLNELTSSKANIQMRIDDNDSTVNAKAHHNELITKIKSLVKETDLVIIIADMQKAIYQSLAVEISKASIADDILTVGIENNAVQNRNNIPDTLDFERNIDAFIKVNDSIIVLDKNSEEKPLVSELIAKAVNTIVFPLVYISFIAIDFNDLQSLLKNSGKALVAQFKTTKTDNIKEIIESFQLNPKKALFNISTNSNFAVDDFKNMLNEIENCFDKDCKEIVCLHLSDSIPKDTFNISILSCGL